MADCQKSSSSASPALAAWAPESLPLPPGATRPWINVIRGSGPEDVWLLCNVSLNRVAQRLAFHYDGKAWQLRQDVPPRARDSIYPITRDDVWAVGTQGGAAHFDGRTWTQYPFLGFYYDLLDVFARPGNDVWAAAAEARVVHFDGQKWTVLRAPELGGDSIHVIWGTAQQILVPVNFAQPPSRIARYDGQQWSSEEVGPGGLTLLGGTGPDLIWALSRRGQGYRFDGKKWTRYPTWPDLRLALYALSVAGSDRAYTVGDGGLILRWDGAAWGQSPSGTTERLVSVYAPASGKAWVGGDHLYREK